MSGFLGLFYTGLTLVSSLIILWLTTNYMIENKRIKRFLPFFIIGILYSFNAVFNFLEVYFSWSWFFLEVFVLVAIFWIFIIIRREDDRS